MREDRKVWVLTVMDESDGSEVVISVCEDEERRNEIVKEVQEKSDFLGVTSSLVTLNKLDKRALKEVLSHLEDQED